MIKLKIIAVVAAFGILIASFPMVNYLNKVANERFIVKPITNIELTESNLADLSNEVNDLTVTETLDKLDSLDKSKPRYLFLRSPGGDVYSGTKLVEYLRGKSGKGVVCIGATAISMAFVIMQACETRAVPSMGILMTHGVQLAGLTGSIEQVQKQIQQSKMIEDMIDEMQAKRLGISVKELQERQNPEWWIMGSKNILQARAADIEVTYSCDTTLKGSKKIKVNTPIGIMEYDVRKCPI